jgi:hypothetical protein
MDLVDEDEDVYDAEECKTMLEEAMAELHWEKTDVRHY